MKKSFTYFLLGAITVGLFAFVSNNKEEEKGFHDSFTATLKSAKAYTLEVAENMPAEDYTFKPHDSVRTFGEQMAHIALSSKLMNAMFIKGEKVDFDPAEGAKMEKAVGASKEECIKLLNTDTYGQHSTSKSSLRLHGQYLPLTDRARRIPGVGGQA